MDASGIQSRVVTEPQRDRCRQLLRRRRMRVDRVTASSVRQQTYNLQFTNKNGTPYGVPFLFWSESHARSRVSLSPVM